MKVKLNDRFTLVCDSLTNKYLLEKTTSKKGGDEHERVYCGYHIQFRHSLKHYYLKRLAEIDEMENITEEERKRRFREHFAKIAVKTSKGRTNKKNKSPSGAIGKRGGRNDNY